MSISNKVRTQNSSINNTITKGNSKMTVNNYAHDHDEVLEEVSL